ncbi:Cwc25 [Kluyveromyces lactis]|nr:Cwc25 [Kluyveromyces lactis]
MSDLNLLKSWNPKLVKNRKKVWEAQQQLVEENKKIKERQKEIEKERELDRYSSLTRDETRKNLKKKTGLEWMYDNTSTALTENEDYLLGKKEITDTLLNLSGNNNKSEKPENQKQTIRKHHKGIEDVVSSKTNHKNTDLSSDDPMAKFKSAKQAHFKTLKQSIKPSSQEYSLHKSLRGANSNRYDSGNGSRSNYKNSRYNNKYYRS